MSERQLSNWQWRSLESLGDYQNGFAFSGQHWSEHGLPIVRIAQITGSQEIVDRYPGRLPDTYLLDNGDLIFSWSGTLAVVRWFGGPAWLNQHLFKVVPRDGVDRSFLFHVLQSSVAEMTKRTHGSTMKHIKRGELREFVVGVPAGEKEQRQIAEVLDSLDNAIRETEAIIAKLKLIKQGLLHDLLTRGIDGNGELRPPYSEAPHLYKASPLGWIPKEWSIALLDSVAERGSGHTPNKSVRSYWNGGIKWVSLADSSRLDKIFIKETDKQISSLGIANSSAVLHPRGTVVVSRDAGIGKSAVLADDMAVSQHFIAWRCGPQLNNLFLYFYLQREKPRLEAIAMGSTIKTIGLPFFKSYKIVVAPRSEQDQAVAILMNAERTIGRHSDELEKLKQLKRGLVDDLLTGRVRVTTLLDQGN